MAQSQQRSHLQQAYDRFCDDWQRDPATASLDSPPFHAWVRSLDEARSRSPPPASAYQLRMQQESQLPIVTRRSTPSLSGRSVGRTNDDDASSSTTYGDMRPTQQELRDAGEI